ncbi:MULTISPECIES: sensor histidine kinase [unclassified Streptomyces]|uniref:sensor histidine kinase n=1 Tax=unclassified Streptomyces TaxID=2593676 RepID=UPI002E2EA5A9|nr:MULTISPECIES: ATP-binding protein [unclassified Streptomyces]
MRTPRRRPQAAPPARGRRAHAGPPADEPPDGARSDAPGSSAPDKRPRIRLRPGTVRAKVVSLLMVPVVSLLGLWGFATVSTAQDIARLGRVQRIDAQIRTPLTAALTELQAERRAAVRFLADPAAEQGAALEQQARRTDAAVRRLRLGDRNTVADSGDHPREVVARLGAFVAAAEQLGPFRGQVAGRATGADTAYETYTRVADAALAAAGSLSGGREPELGAGDRVLLEFGRAGELLSREDALLALPGASGASGASGGQALRRLTGVIETRRAVTDSAARDLPDAGRRAWEAVTGSAPYAALTGAEERALGTAAPGNGSAAKEAHGVPAGWDSAYAEVGASLREIADAAHAGATGRTGAAGRSGAFAEGAFGASGAAVLLGLAAVAASLVISVRIGRALVVELVSLRNTALEIAHRKLPHAMERLRSGQEIDIDAETTPGPAADDEIAQVGEALSTVHRAALSAAVERAELADGVSGVFVNLARRSQVLVHKQLTLLDSMERRAEDPSELGDLFRLDHLTTRMRRHAESLIILSGAAPGRAWRVPVPLTNVVRAAVSEIEDYPRVEVRRLAEAAIVGGAVADLTHLLAELIENAAQFSPPHTKVRVTGEPVGAGYVVEVEDRGLGMGSAALDEANRRIEQSEALDLFDSDRLGLFVVSRLAARHGIRVQLRTSPYGGTTAVVLLPNSVIQGVSTAVPPQPAEEPELRRPAPAPPEEPEPRRPAPVASLRPRGPGGGDTSRKAPAAASPPPAAVTELPRRVRQASLVPQLREVPAPAEAAGAPRTGEPPGRSPEQARDRMAAYRAGWARGAREKSPHHDSEGES